MAGRKRVRVPVCRASPAAALYRPYGAAFCRVEAQMRKVNLAEAFGTFSDHWSPKVAGELNDSLVKLVKLSGQFDWHHHEVEDELFLVVSGRLRMGLRTGDIDLDPGEFIIVPHGVEHRPEALTDECHVVLLEPKTTLNTGNVVNDRTVRVLGTI
jgi:mannose-6-phosphate isomerase-like protein (cupin superfamily)